jgi:hypothetical protein
LNQNKLLKKQQKEKLQPKVLPKTLKKLVQKENLKKLKQMMAKKAPLKLLEINQNRLLLIKDNLLTKKKKPRKNKLK